MSFEARREMGVGAAVLTAAVMMFGFSALGIGDRSEGTLGGDGAYDLKARFGQADGIAPGTAVRMAGIPVGEVVSLHLDPYYRAVVTFRVMDTVEVPEDSAAAIQTDGLMGGKFVELEPGGALDVLGPGDWLDYSQDSVIIEDLLSKIVARAKQERGLDPNKPVGY
ncbi:MCE family protein [Roseospira marina]|uniref:MCE family protein n=1 Tax=Roseospira marina TaxID=140057 RepID=A0A5M6IGJ6_9PROT|nr:MlaD family protein [Roseospira marina]KAA5607430.1 MCE family protein [Roseospira marina]MBB4312393.1 phospholipid/cholesterol/gamma-HCH transport system substrate-binding protein [Roseospira marina]MBB5085591.1 phospholipid/cholesterol/gamma-HCH transport system substrate-binding protein [Roseospira marina]